MAKTELIQARYGRLLVRLGAFPVRRGEADEEALETARTILRQGGLLARFPEGTRIRDPDQLGHSRRGAARLVDELLWPEVEGEFHRLRARPGLIAASLAALGIGGGLLVRRGRTPPPKRRLPAAMRGGAAKRLRLKRRRRSGLPWR
jgi:1-acyl-sn-glycerol-3-phosphate acyltransferase